MTLSRRDFVKGSLAAVSVAAFSPVLKAGVLGSDALGDRHLVILQLIGGNDTINTFIPYTDSRYRTARPQLGIPDAGILQVDSKIGFHSALSGLRDLYLQRKLAVVPHVGFSSLDRSHFRCEDVWMTANENPAAEPRGWIGRWADLYTNEPHSPVSDIGFATSTPRGLVASRVLPTCLNDLESFTVEGDATDSAEATLFANTLRANYAIKRDDAQLEVVRGSGNTAFGSIDLLATVPSASVTAKYPNTALGKAFGVIARIIQGNIGAKIFWVTLGGFDTHAAQVKPAAQGGALTGTHAGLLANVSSSLAAFQSDIEARGMAERTMVLAWSEFGRRVAENASLGTDHGKAGSLMLLGTRVEGGQFYGDAYDLATLDEGDLRTHVDFRAAYATIIRDWLGGDPEAVLGGRFENLGFIEKAAVRRRAV